MSRLRIMRVIARMNVGGPAVQVSGLMRHLDPASYEHRLFTGWCADDEADYLETQAPDVSATRITGLGRAIRPGDDARALAALVREVRHFRPHIIHTHTAKAGILGRAAAQVAATGAATVHTFHGHLLHGYFSPAKTRAVVALESALALRTERLVAVGAQVRDDLLAAGIGKPDQFDIIPPGVDLASAPTQDEARRRLGLTPHQPVVSFIGRLAPIKRPDRFLEVVELVHGARPDVRFVVAGEGAGGGAVRAASERLPITMLGWRDDVETVLAASNAVLLTSDNEGTPLSLIQAALAGIPVVATSVGSVPEVVVDGSTGWLTAAEPGALAAAMTELLDDPVEARRRGTSAKQYARERYGVLRLASDHDRIYQAIARGRRR